MGGSLSCVGTGMLLGGHLLARSKSMIESADAVFILVSDPLVEQWLMLMRPDAVSLQSYYAVGKSRRETYDQIVGRVLDEVRAGRHVCAAFYGHPGVFASVPHRLIAGAASEGFQAFMEPGISAEDCLYADMGFDPGAVGCQHYEASQFLFYKRAYDPSAYLILWQIGVVGDRSLARTATSQKHRGLLVDLLSEKYPLEHELVVYEAATLPIAAPRIDRFSLHELPGISLSTQSTLVIPPAFPMEANREVLDRLAKIEAEVC